MEAKKYRTTKDSMFTVLVPGDHGGDYRDFMVDKGTRVKIEGEDVFVLGLDGKTWFLTSQMVQVVLDEVTPGLYELEPISDSKP